MLVSSLAEGLLADRAHAAKNVARILFEVSTLPMVLGSASYCNPYTAL